MLQKMKNGKLLGLVEFGPVKSRSGETHQHQIMKLRFYYFGLSIFFLLCFLCHCFTIVWYLYPVEQYSFLKRSQLLLVLENFEVNKCKECGVPSSLLTVIVPFSSTMIQEYSLKNNILRSQNIKEIVEKQKSE